MKTFQLVIYIDSSPPPPSMILPQIIKSFCGMFVYMLRYNVILFALGIVYVWARLFNKKENKPWLNSMSKSNSEEQLLLQ